MNRHHSITQSELATFVAESNRIEGITRRPTIHELCATEQFLQLRVLILDAVVGLQQTFAPGKPLRASAGWDVQVGNYVAPVGGPRVVAAFIDLLTQIDRGIGAGRSPWRAHIEFEKLHPFMDGNGRTGRAIWAWHMLHRGSDPFRLPFLQHYYYQTLGEASS